jgi:hypothetical protein
VGLESELSELRLFFQNYFSLLLLQELNLDFIIKLIKNTFKKKKGQRTAFRAKFLGEAGRGNGSVAVPGC